MRHVGCRLILAYLTVGVVIAVAENVWGALVGNLPPLHERDR